MTQEVIPASPAARHIRGIISGLIRKNDHNVWLYIRGKSKAFEVELIDVGDDYVVCKREGFDKTLIVLIHAIDAVEV